MQHPNMATTVSADDLAPNSARPSAATEMTKKFYLLSLSVS